MFATAASDKLARTGVLPFSSAIRPTCRAISTRRASRYFTCALWRLFAPVVINTAEVHQSFPWSWFRTRSAMFSLSPI